MKTLRLAALAATGMLAATQAQAVTYIWASGTYNPGTTSPSPLLAGDILSIEGSGNKTFGSGAFVNQTGTVNWLNGTLFLSGGSASVTNAGTWNMLGDNVWTFSSGGGTFTNTGLLAKTGGSGVSSVNPNNFVNSGTINAQVGTIELGGGTVAINAGSVFSGAGTVLLNSNATFSGGFTSSNLDLQGANYTGNAAVLNGSMDFRSGSMDGGWTIAGGATLNLDISSNKGFGSGTITNNGTVVWNDGTLFMSGGSSNIVNAGVFNATADNVLTFSSGGGTFTNSGVFRKSGGTGTTNFSVVNLANTGTFDAQSGTIAISGTNTAFNAGTSFTGAGIVRLDSNATFTGAFSSTKLDLAGGTYTGNGAVMSGSADFLSGSFGGTWNVASGATLNINGSSNKSFNSGTFDNDGTMVWNNGTLFLSGGSADLRNDGLFVATGDNVMTFSSGGGTVTNNGVIRKTGGTGVTVFSPPVVNNGLIDVQSGTIALPGNFTNPGTMAGSGTFSVSGTLTNNGTIAPGNGGGAIGTLALTGNYAQGAGGLFSVGLGAGTADLFNISGSAALNGTLGLNCVGCSFNVGDVFTVLDAGGALSGTFANVTTTGFNAGFLYTVLYNTQLSQVQVRIDNVGTPPVGGAVPEPATWAMMLLGFGALGGMLRRRGRQTLRVRYA